MKDLGIDPSFISTGNSKKDVKKGLENKKCEFERNGLTIKKKVEVKTVDDSIDIWLETEYNGAVKLNTEKGAIMMVNMRLPVRWRVKAYIN